MQERRYLMQLKTILILLSKTRDYPNYIYFFKNFNHNSIENNLHVLIMIYILLITATQVIKKTHLIKNLSNHNLYIPKLSSIYSRIPKAEKTYSK